jgi:biopolymer transport protein ExbD
MVEKRRFLDVWIVESNTVYKEVPFTVVADWVQQGRLLEDDMLKPSGTKEWVRLGASPEFTPYLPRPEPYRANDQAEALEPVGLDFAYRHPRDEEDDDPDMIPLIDVSLVLLIFFMLTASAIATGMNMPLPDSTYPSVSTVNPDEITVNMNLEGEGDARTPVYSIGVGNQPSADPADQGITDWNQLLARINEKLQGSGRTEVTINAHPDLKAVLVRRLTVDLGKEPLRGKVGRVLIGVNEKQP